MMPKKVLFLDATLMSSPESIWMNLAQDLSGAGSESHPAFASMIFRDKTGMAAQKFADNPYDTKFR
jgi:hypothetical protein